MLLEYSPNRRPALTCLPQFLFLDRTDESAPPASVALLEEEFDRIRKCAGGSLMVLILSDGHGQVPT